VTAYLVGQADLAWAEDITPVYSPFEASIELLKQGQAGAVILPEPNVSLLESQPDIYISLELAHEWNRYNPGDAGYPQVGSFVNANWAGEHHQQIEQFNQALTEAIALVERDPSGSVEAVKNSYKIPPEILLKSLNRTGYTMLTGQVMQQTIANYYVTIGKPLDETFSDFYYLSAQ
jgi:ABC-type nitrate/sulfonate/bicarbonate transport system substrate-binding protein